MIDRYIHPNIQTIWELRNKYRIWRDIEVALMQNLGCEDVPEISIDDGAVKAILKIEEKTRHDVAAFVQWMEQTLELRGYEHSNKVHYGITSSDVVDCGLSIQLKQSNRIIYGLAQRLSDRLAGIAHSLESSEHPARAVGRTHGQAAEIIYVHDRFKAWNRALKWAIEQLHNVTFFGRIAGSLGDNKYIPQPIATEIVHTLGLKEGMIQGQVISRAWHADLMNRWAVLAGVIEKIATDIRLLSQTGIEEIMEDFIPGQIGSSSMPHKRNPIGSENICGVARMIRGYAAAALQNIALWNERDISHSSVERVIFPDAANLLAYALQRMMSIFDNLSWSWGNMENAIEKNARYLGSQAAMLDDIDAGLSREEAHQKNK